MSLAWCILIPLSHSVMFIRCLHIFNPVAAVFHNFLNIRTVVAWSVSVLDIGNT